jgi:hypothetical protein
MVEIIQIISQIALIFFLLFFVSPISLMGGNTFKNYDNFKNINLNILISLNFILFLGILNFKLSNIILSYLIFLSFCFFINFLNKKENYFNNLNSLLFLFLITLILSIDVSYNLYLTWDAQKLWFFKTLNFYNNNNLDNLNNLPYSHYPFLGSLLWATFWKLSFLQNEYSGRIFYIFLFIISIFSLVEILNKDKITKFIVLILVISLIYKYELFGGDQDIIIFCLITMASKEIYLLRNENKNNIQSLIVLILTSNALIWIKNEGTIYAFSLIFIAILFGNLKLNYKILLIIGFFISLLMRVLIFKIYNFTIHINPCCYTDFSITSILNKISFDRIVLILTYIFYSFFENIIFIAFIFLNLTLLLLKKIKVEKFHYIYFFLFLHISFICGASLMTDSPLEFQLKTSVNRLMFQGLGFYILFIIQIINEYSTKIKKKIIIK